MDHTCNSVFTVCIKKCYWQSCEQEKGEGRYKSLLNVNRVNGNFMGGGLGKVLRLDCSMLLMEL